MGRDWERLAGDEGAKITTGRLGRAVRLGRIAGRVAGGFLRDSIEQRLQGKRGHEAEVEALLSSASRNAREVVAALGQLKGAAMKVGQLLSTDPELINPAFAEELAVLQRSAPPMSYRVLSEAIEERLERPMSELFHFFDPTPLGSASIGQVHRAILGDGREVAIKIQYPGIAGSLESDLRNLAAVLKLARVFLSPEQVEGFIEEARSSLERELDYEQEALNLERFRAYFRDWDRVRIPAPIPELCAPGILTMDYLAGVPLPEACRELPVEERSEVGELFIELFIHMFHELHALHGDPHPGNFLLDDERRIILLDFGCVRDFDPETGDQVLRALVATDRGDAQGAFNTLRELGFGRPDAKLPTPDQLLAHHQLILAPFLEGEHFNFAHWRVHEPLRLFLRENLELLQMTPPAELLIYLRVLAGIKGILTQLDAPLPVRSTAEQCCERRGLGGFTPLEATVK